MSQVRLRRLQSDFESLSALARRHPRLSIVQAVGSPPDRYQINYKVRSLRKAGDSFTYVTDHLVEITLPTAFPRTPPLCRMLTPIFHPNIAPHAICIGDHWSPGETLSSLVIRIAEMLAFQSYNTRSPLNGEAAKWTEQNLTSLPLDSASMTLDDAPPADGASASRPAAEPASGPVIGQTPPSAARTVEIPCSSCGAILRIPISASAVRVRCPKCRNLTTVDVRGSTGP